MITQNQRDTLARCLTQIFGRIDDGFVDAAVPLLKWTELTGGETLMSAGDPADGVYFVISGRLRAYVTQENEDRSIGEIGRGETVGEMGVLTGEPRTATVVAVRDTVLAHATREAFNELLLRHPELSIHMARIIIERLKRSATRPPVRKPATICLLGITAGVDVRSIASTLVQDLGRWGVATMETRERIDIRFGAGAAETTQRDSETYRRVTAWLDEVEFANDFIVLLADGDTEWTRRCLRQADEVLLLARAEAPVQLHPLEERLCMGEHAVTRARQTLVLLHDTQRAHPSGTGKWLDRRPVDAHVHVRPALVRDMARLARVVSGNAVGLVLAGGGARGFAHLGVYKALEEAGVEIDFVGGTSMGAIIAAYISLGHSAEELIGFVRSAFAKNPTGDLNFLPLLSLIKGNRIKAATSRAVLDATGSVETDVADSWRTLYCVASNYSSAREMVITRGRLDRAVRASLAIPVALPPVLWEGELLIDGAVFNNFPTDVMAKKGAQKIIGVDLSRPSCRRYEFEEMPSTWELLLDRFRGRKKRRYKLPTLGALLMRTTILYSESRGEQAKESVDMYLNPDLGGVGLLDWKGFDRIVEIGYRHAKNLLAGMTDEELAAYRNEVGWVKMTA
ncbi:MAG TPA: patatin-like phospholipase family protein [Thermoanaerobaculia bacterium]